MDSRRNHGKKPQNDVSGKKPDLSLETFFKRKSLSSSQRIPALEGKSTNPFRERFGIEGYELTGRLPRKLKRLAVQQNLSSYSKVSVIYGDVYSESSPSLSIQTSSVEFDPGGQHVVSTTTSGQLAIHKFDCCIDSGGHRVMRVSIPLKYRLEQATWNPGNPNEVGCVADKVNSVFCVDLGASGNKITRLDGDKRSSSEGRSGLYCLRYSNQSRYRLLACGVGGRVLLWDQRRNSPYPSSSIIAPPSLGPLHSLQLSVDEQVVYAGSDSGIIQAWDLRGSRQSAAFCGANEVYHAPLMAFSIRRLLSKVPTLQEQAGLGPSAVCSILFDPSNSQHLGFHLFNGWSGVLDIGDMELSHIHCPPTPEALASLGEPESIYTARVRNRRPVWLPSNSIYCAPSSISPDINFLDFGSSPFSRFSLQSSTEPQLEETEEKLSSVNCDKLVVCVASHPTTNVLIAGTEDASLMLVSSNKCNKNNSCMKCKDVKWQGI